jgi:hypothetical protein
MATDADRKQWHQTWMDSSGGVLQIDGRFADGRMTLTGDAPGEKPGETVRNRITWTPLSDGKVRQLWESSNDGGKTWTTGVRRPVQPESDGTAPSQHADRHVDGDDQHHRHKHAGRVPERHSFAANAGIVIAAVAATA